jgi:DNA-binding Xre family transcriptional regulator
VTGDVTTGEMIKEYIDERGIKQTKLAANVGVSNQKMNYILNGKQEITFKLYESICDALNEDLYKFSKRKLQQG